jgi:hypothetical protein
MINCAGLEVVEHERGEIIEVRPLLSSRGDERGVGVGVGEVRG